MMLSRLISKFVALKEVNGEFCCLCPFHTESSPSFFVYDKQGIYRCFGCGKFGSALNFLMEYKKINYQAAVEELNTFSGEKY